MIAKILKNGEYTMVNEPPKNSNVMDMKAYKLARVFAKDMEKIIPRLQAAILFLKPYERYSQVAPVIAEMEQRLVILQAQYKRYSAIVKSKGKR
jgi:hypothetical protein